MTTAEARPNADTGGWVPDYPLHAGRYRVRFTDGTEGEAYLLPVGGWSVPGVVYWWLEAGSRK